jgi:hypothetical protein
MTSATIVGVLVGYLVILLAIGLWGSRESHDLKGYYVAGKRLPAWVIAFSSNATGESAWLLLGLTGMGYAIGVHAFWVILGEVLGVAAAWVFVARPFKEYTDRYDAITVPDYLTERFGGAGSAFRILSAVIILSMVMAYTAAQLTASGKAFDSFLGTGYTAGVWIGLAIVLFYTTIGGFKAVAYSDFLQGVLMLGCLVTLPIVAIPAAGGFEEAMAALGAADPDLLRPMGAFGLSAAGIASAFGFVAIGFAFLGSPQLLTRFMAARDQKQIVDGGFWAVLCVIGFDVGAVFASDGHRALPPLLHRDLPGGGSRGHHVHRRLPAHPGVVGRGAGRVAEDPGLGGVGAYALPHRQGGDGAHRCGGHRAGAHRGPHGLLLRPLRLVRHRRGVHPRSALLLVLEEDDASGGGRWHGGRLSDHGPVGGALQRALLRLV